VQSSAFGERAASLSWLNKNLYNRFGPSPLPRMSYTKRHDYFVLEEPSAHSEAQEFGHERVIHRECLDAARLLLQCISKRESYRLEACCRPYAALMISRQNNPIVHSLCHEERTPKPFDHPSCAPPPPLDDRHTACFLGGCVIDSHPALSAGQYGKNALDETPGVFIVRETLLDSSACMPQMKVPVKLERFISDVCDIMQHAQPGACNDFATSRLALLDLEYSRYR
jgi:hypothetical protein